MRQQCRVWQLSDKSSGAGFELGRPMSILEKTFEEKIVGWSDVVRHVAITVTIALLPVTIIYLLILGDSAAAIMVALGRLATWWIK